MTACPSAKADCGADSIDAKRAPRVPVNIERDVVPMEPAVHQRAGMDPAGRRGFVEPKMALDSLADYDVRLTSAGMCA